MSNGDAPSSTCTCGGPPAQPPRLEDALGDHANVVVSDIAERIALSAEKPSPPPAPFQRIGGADQILFKCRSRKTSSTGAPDRYTGIFKTRARYVFILPKACPISGCDEPFHLYEALLADGYADFREALKDDPAILRYKTLVKRLTSSKATSPPAARLTPTAPFEKQEGRLDRKAR